MEALAKFFELLKAPIRLIIGAFVVDAILVFGPNSFLKRLGVLQYREEGKPYFGWLLALLTAWIVAAIAGAIEDKLKEYLFLRDRKKRLALLTAEEKNVLRRYIEGKTRSLYLDIGSPLVKGLENEAIIYRSTSISSPMHGFGAFGYNIQDWAWEYLNEHRDLLGLSARDETTK
jgi:Super-infection exclusion protein B